MCQNGQNGTRFIIDLEAGWHIIMIEGANNIRGNYTISITCRLPDVHPMALEEDFPESNFTCERWSGAAPFSNATISIEGSWNSSSQPTTTTGIIEKRSVDSPTMGQDLQTSTVPDTRPTILLGSTISRAVVVQASATDTPLAARTPTPSGKDHATNPFFTSLAPAMSTTYHAFVATTNTTVEVVQLEDVQRASTPVWKYLAGIIAILCLLVIIMIALMVRNRRQARLLFRVQQRERFSLTDNKTNPAFCEDDDTSTDFIALYGIASSFGDQSNAPQVADDMPDNEAYFDIAPESDATYSTLPPSPISTLEPSGYSNRPELFRNQVSHPSALSAEDLYSDLAAYVKGASSEDAYCALSLQNHAAADNEVVYGGGDDYVSIGLSRAEEDLLYSVPNKRSIGGEKCMYRDIAPEEVCYKDIAPTTE